MEICDNCGKTIPRTIDNLHSGCGDIDSGYFCDGCYEKEMEIEYVED